MLKRGILQKRGKSGVYFDRFAVRGTPHACSLCSHYFFYTHYLRPGHFILLRSQIHVDLQIITSDANLTAQLLVPQRLYILRSKSAFLPIGVISLADAKPVLDGPGRTVHFKASPSELGHGKHLTTAERHARTKQPFMSLLKVLSALWGVA